MCVCLSAELDLSGWSCISVQVSVKITTLKLNSSVSVVGLNRKWSVHTSRVQCQCILKYFRIGRVLAIWEDVELRMLNAVIVEVFLFLKPMKLQDQLLNKYLRWKKNTWDEKKKSETQCNARKQFKDMARFLTQSAIIM